MSKRLIGYLWGEEAKPWLLWLVAALVIFGMLGSRMLWTMENRWADIVMNMLYTHDYFHPHLRHEEYYDKPLLSYWLIAGLSKLFSLNTWTLRLPSAVAGFLTVFASYRLGCRLSSKRLGFIVAWLLVSTFYFIYWARVSSTDMLNAAGIMLAVMWYFETKASPRFWHYAVFFLILVLASLSKGIVAVACTGLAILPDVWHEGEWKRHFNLSFLAAALFGLALYVAPFVISSHFSHGHYGENGLYQVYRENILRFFHPWDHKGPMSTYFIALPGFTLPWFFLLIPAMISSIMGWKKLPWHSKWICLSTLLLFLFFTASQSRRYYYILPVVPFAILWVADWIDRLRDHDTLQRVAAWGVVLSALVLFLMNVVFVPLYYSGGGERVFGKDVRQAAIEIKPWNQWKVVMLDPRLRDIFYVEPSKRPHFYDVKPKNTTVLSHLIESWPFLLSENENAIYITKAKYAAVLLPMMEHYKVIYTRPILADRLADKHDEDDPVAFIPLG